jgi:hypothetical protein
MHARRSVLCHAAHHMPGWNTAAASLQQSISTSISPRTSGEMHTFRDAYNGYFLGVGLRARQQSTFFMQSSHSYAGTSSTGYTGHHTKRFLRWRQNLQQTATLLSCILDVLKRKMATSRKQQAASRHAASMHGQHHHTHDSDISSNVPQLFQM